MSEEEQKIEIVDASNNDGASVSVDVESILNPPEEEVQENTITVPDKFKNEDGSVNSDALLIFYHPGGTLLLLNRDYFIIYLK